MPDLHDQGAAAPLVVAAVVLPIVLWLLRK